MALMEDRFMSVYEEDKAAFPSPALLSKLENADDANSRADDASSVKAALPSSTGSRSGVADDDDGSDWSSVSDEGVYIVPAPRCGWPRRQTLSAPHRGMLVVPKVPVAESVNTIRHTASHHLLDAGSRMCAADLVKSIPRNEAGELTSLGSVGHDAGTCSPCVFWLTNGKCRQGAICRFCHFPHKKGHPSLQKGARTRQRSSEPGSDSPAQ